MRRLLFAFARGEEQSVRSMMSQSESTLVIGSDAAEWLYGLEAVEVSAAQAAVAGYEVVINRIDAHEEGSIGWAAADVIANFDRGFTSEFRVTSVFALEQGVWRVVQWHASVPSPINETSGRSVPTSLGDLVELDSDLERVLRARFQTSTKSFLFTDIEGSTEHTEVVGDVMWGDVVQRHFADVERVVNANDGDVVKTLGDGAMSVFGVAEDAVRAAIAVQRSVGRQAPPRPFKVRIGVHTGEVLHIDGDYLGQTVNTAARLAAAATGGQILVSGQARHSVETDIRLRFGEPIRLELKGIADPVTAYPVVVG